MRRQPRVVPFLLAALLAVAIGGCGPAVAAEAATVQIANLGTTAVPITWTGSDGLPHADSVPACDVYQVVASKASPVLVLTTRSGPFQFDARSASSIGGWLLIGADGTVTPVQPERVPGARPFC
jgi:hypothetical protein